MAQSDGGPNPIQVVQRSEDDLLLLSLHLGNITLADDLEAYQYPGGVLLPLGRVCSLLEIGVKVSASSGTAEGFVLRGDRKFRLDLAKRSATINGVELPFDGALGEVHSTDIYLDAKLLSKWFGLGLIVDTHISAIRVFPSEPLPLQKRQERERLAAVYRSITASYQDHGYPVAPTEEQQIGGPVIDQSFSIVSNGGPTPGAMARYTAQLTADIERVDFNSLIDLESAHNQTFSYVSLGQTDPDGGLLGSLHAKQFAVGQEFVPAVPMVSSTNLMDGLFVSNFPLYHSAQYDTTTFSGVLAPGWDVELFRDQALIAYTESNPANRYEFKDVPLIFGMNHYRLVFNGPLGETRVEDRNLDVASSLAPKGTNWYQAAVQPSLGQPLQYSWQDELGISRNASASLGMTSVPLADGTHTYTSATLQGYSLAGFGGLDVVVDPRSGAAEQMDFQTVVRHETVDLKQTIVQGLESPLISKQVNPVLESTLLDVGGIDVARWTGFLPLDVSLQHADTRLGYQTWTIQDRVSMQSKGLSVTNWLSWQSQTNNETYGKGELLLDTWGRGKLLQAQIYYDWLKPERLDLLSIRSTSITHDLKMLTLGAYVSSTNGDKGISATLAKNVGNVAYALSLGLSSVNGLSLGISVSTSLIRNPRGGRWDSDAQPQTNRGAVLVRVFFSTSGNCAWDRHKQALPGVEVMVNGQSYGRVTDKDGTLLIKGLTLFRKCELEIATSSLTNPLWVSAEPGLRLIPKPGIVQVIDFPIVSTGEISGSVFNRIGTAMNPVPGIQLELVNAKGEVIQRQTTTFDGFFTFLHVPVGSLRLRVASDQVEQLGLVEAAMPIAIPPEGAFLDDVNLEVRRKT